MSVKSFFAAVGSFFTALFAGFVAFFFWNRFKNNNLVENEKSPDEIRKESEKAKEEKENEIKNTDSGDLVKSSDNYSNIQSGIEKLQSDSTDRIRNRLKEKL